MRSAARLHRCNLPRFPDIADIEYANSAKALGVDRSLNALSAAVQAAARLFHRHEEQISVNRYVALAAGAHDRAEKPRLLWILYVVRVESVEISHDEIVSAECQIRVCEI
jgi:hypothetical protein